MSPERAAGHGRPAVITGRALTADLARFCAGTGRRRLLIVADGNTWPILGEAVQASLRAAGLEARSVVLKGREVAADAGRILQCLLACDGREQTFISVGSGTITDITRFVSHRTGGSFIAMPTAPSVDGFTSLGSPLIVEGIKTTALAHPPAAVFADLGVLAGAPRSMIASGFGDMLGKYTSVADWRLARLLWGMPYDEGIARRCLEAAAGCTQAAPEIAGASEHGVHRLLGALLESGLCMLDFGSSLPASGAEHHYSHFWEMKLLREGRPAILHGAKVGVAAISLAGLYEQVGCLPRERLVELLKASRLPSSNEETRRIRSAYGPMAEEILKAQADFLAMSEKDFQGLKERIIDHWAEIREIAREVPAPEELAGLIRTVGGPVTMAELGLSDSDLEQAAGNALYLRNHFTISRLTRIIFCGAGGA